MSVKITVPALGESVSEASIASWLKREGDTVAQDEPVVAVESEKATMELPAPAAGKLSRILVAAGGKVAVGDVIGEITVETQAAQPRTEGPPLQATRPASAPDVEAIRAADAKPLSPAVRRLVSEHGVDPEAVAGTGPHGRVLKGDVLEHLEQQAGRPTPAATATAAVSQASPAAGPAPITPAAAAPAPAPAPAPRPVVTDGAREQVVAMTPVRRTIAQRLVQAQHTAAILTTFNEVDMTRVSDLRSRHQERFVARHGVKLGFMSFFVRASIEALRTFPAVNAEVRGENIVYKNHYDIGVAVGGGKGLVVPVLRDADQQSLAGIEKQIADFGKRAGENRLRLDELQGGTFTISNGGIYGSMMSTPILNPPQSGILGMHKIQRRPVAVGEGAGERVEIRPMMFLALSYDHRIVDGREAVQFLVRVKECIEDPERLLLEV